MIDPAAFSVSYGTITVSLFISLNHIEVITFINVHHRYLILMSSETVYTVYISYQRLQTFIRYTYDQLKLQLSRIMKAHFASLLIHLGNIYGSDVLIATGNSFTGNVLKAGYTEKMAGDMIMPNGLAAYSSKMSGAELKEIIKNFVEGYEGGFIPFNRGSLPVVSGISVEINETEDGYTLSKVTKDGKAVRDEDTFTVTCLATPQHMETYPVDENMIFDGGATSVKDTWTAYVSGGNAVLAEPEDYITLR